MCNMCNGCHQQRLYQCYCQIKGKGIVTFSIRAVWPELIPISRQSACSRPPEPLFLSVPLSLNPRSACWICMHNAEIWQVGVVYSNCHCRSYQATCVLSRDLQHVRSSNSAVHCWMFDFHRSWLLAPGCHKLVMCAFLTFVYCSVHKERSPK